MRDSTTQRHSRFVFCGLSTSSDRGVGHRCYTPASSTNTVPAHAVWPGFVQTQQKAPKLFATANCQLLSSKRKNKKVQKEQTEKTEKRPCCRLCPLLSTCCHCHILSAGQGWRGACTVGVLVSGFVFLAASKQAWGLGFERVRPWVSDLSLRL